MKIRNSFLTGVVLVNAVLAASSTDENYGYSLPVYPSPMGGRISGDWSDAYTKARAFVSQLTLLEKVNLTTGTGWEMGRCVGNTGEIPRIGFPSLCLQDSPLGIRFTDLNSVFPAGLAAAATFNKNLMYLRGKAMGMEFKGKGINGMLAPCIGPIGRAPEGGRNWEAFGADPYLQGVASYQSVLGIQEEGVIATAKHYLLNEQEHFRQYAEWVKFYTNLSAPYSANVDERALREIYAWPFADAIRAGAAAIMCSYNQVNNSQACQNSYLLNGILKDELGFQGFVMSDWLGQRSGVASVLAGMDMTMPGDGLAWADGVSLLGSNLTTAVLNGSVPLWRLDDMATRIMAAYYKVGQDPSTYPEPNFSSWTLSDYGLEIAGSLEGPTGLINKHVDVRTPLSRQITRQIAQESMVLVKNTNNALPLNNVRRLGLFGSAAGPPTLGPNGCIDRGCDNGTLGIGWGSGTANYPYLLTPLEVINAMAIAQGTSVQYNLDDYDLDNVATLAGVVDTAVVFITSDSGEGYLHVEGNMGDRNNLSAWHGGDNLVKAVASENSNTIVVVESVGGIDLEAWIQHVNVTAVLFSLVPGQDLGVGIADILYGTVSPSGKLPFTIAKNASDYPATVIYDVIEPIPQINFSESIFVDYRHFDKYDIEPRYEFGFGLSYTTFQISGLSVTRLNGVVDSEVPPDPPSYSSPLYLNSSLPSPSSAIYPGDIPRYSHYIYPYIEKDIAESITYNPDDYEYPEGYSDIQPSKSSPAGGASGGNPALWDVLVQAKASITNNGTTGGSEVLQLYVSYPAVDGVNFPVRTLRGFEKLSASPGETSTANFDLMRRDLSYYDVASRNWLLPRGTYTVYIGTSSRNLAEAGTFNF
ncbi:glycoside hydrolase superfamily [Lipomyces chichibuensis]|uniref:glycoside hydrolase superfamily n=1 Tax=Lipomyces chichibuensis TaxID=1546026 RepID=UPI0033439EF9